MRNTLLKAIDKQIDSLDVEDVNGHSSWFGFKEFTEEFFKDWDKNMDRRKQAFSCLIEPHLKKYGREMCNQFFKYWTEHSIGHKKMRFEKEKSFDVSKRLARWSRQNQGTEQNTNINLNERNG